MLTLVPENILPSAPSGGVVTSPTLTHPESTALPLEELKRAKKKTYNAAYYVASHAANPEKIRASRAAYHKANAKKIRARQAAYRKANTEKICARKAAYHKANAEKIRAYQAAHYAVNKEKKVSYQSSHIQNRRKTDPSFRLTCSLRARLRAAFKSQRAEKTKSTHELTGCNRDELRQHIASQFREGMTLENHGKVWHIDHIRPCASFDLSDPNQAILCFHYSNLQPLFADENIRKGDRWEPMEIRPLAA